MCGERGTVQRARLLRRGGKESQFEDGDILPEVLEADAILPLATALLAFRNTRLEANRTPPGGARFASAGVAKCRVQRSGLGITMLSCCYPQTLETTFAVNFAQRKNVFST